MDTASKKSASVFRKVASAKVINSKKKISTMWHWKGPCCAERYSQT
jgi:hypothetical protein